MYIPIYCNAYNLLLEHFNTALARLIRFVCYWCIGEAHSAALTLRSRVKHIVQQTIKEQKKSYVITET